MRTPTPRQQEQALIRWSEITLARKHFNGSCFFCGKSIITNRKRPRPHTKISFVGFLYHHLRYFQGEPRRKDYGPNGTWEYKKAVLPIIQRHPEDFLLLDKGCHTILEQVLIKYRKYENFMFRLEHGLRMTKTQTILVKNK